MHKTEHSIYDCIIYMEYGLMFYVRHFMCIYVGSSPCRRIFLLGIAHFVVGPPFRYRGCTERQCSDEVVIVKKADMWP